MPPIIIDIKDAAGNRYGAGPIISANSVQVVRKIDGAGTVTVTMPASDPHAAYVQPKRYADVWVVLPGASAATLIGTFIVDAMPTAVQGAGAPTLKFSGNDLLDELADLLVAGLALRDPYSGGAVTTALQQLIALAPGWSLDGVNGYTTTRKPIYQQLGDESVLQAFNKVAELTGEHFRLGEGRRIVWIRQDQRASGLRAIKPLPGALGLPAGACAITGNPTLSFEAADLVFRVLPFGGGNSDARLTMLGTARKAPAGYTLHTGPGTYDNWLEATARMQAGNYRRISRTQTFSEVSVSTDGGAILDATSAADALFDAAYAWLDKQSQVQRVFQLTLAECPQIVYPGETLRCVFTLEIDGYTLLDVDQDLYVLSSTLGIDEHGIQTVGVEVSTVDRSAPTTASIVARAIMQLGAVQAHYQPQVSAATAATVSDAHVARTDHTNTALDANAFKAGGTPGISIVSEVLAAITLGGTTGAKTYKNGILTAYTAPT